MGGYRKTTKKNALTYESAADRELKQMVKATRRNSFSLARTEGSKASGNIKAADTSMDNYSKLATLSHKVRGGL